MTHASQPRALSIYIVAAEESGDVLGAALARALCTQAGGPLKLSGVGGRAMTAAGIGTPFPIEDLSIIGMTAIPRRLPLIFRRIRETADAVVAVRPDALVIIDSPDFTHRVARRVRRLAPSIPIIDYVSPSVWAWRPGRAHAMRTYVDRVMAILPFEPAVHKRLGGPPCDYVGHPLIERRAELRPGADEMRRRGADPPIVLVLPGSRPSEIQRLLGIFGAAIGLVATRLGRPMDLVLPTLPHLATRVREGIADWALPPRVLVDPAQKWAAFRSAHVALAASGTVTLELALAGVPTVAAYKIPLVEQIIMHLVTLRRKFATVILANLVIGENVVPEFLQRDCTPQRLADALLPLLSETPQRRRQIEAFGRLDSIMAIGTAAPSDKAAAIVLDAAQRGRREPAAVNALPQLS
jgi:lipid-A-disaccharide synthase